MIPCQFGDEAYRRGEATSLEAVEQDRTSCGARRCKTRNALGLSALQRFAHAKCPGAVRADFRPWQSIVAASCQQHHYKQEQHSRKKPDCISGHYMPPSDGIAAGSRSSKAVYCPRNARGTVPMGPLRCLPMIISAKPADGLSGFLL